MHTDFNTTNDKRILKHLLPNNGLLFSRYFFKKREARKFMVNKHHHIVADTLQRVLDLEIKRLIINIPPGYTKTEEAVVNFISRGLAINPQALFMHLSYSDDLALWNSTLIRDTVISPEYQELFPMAIRNDVSSKKKWYTEQGGGLYATSAGGQVTGFRAGRMEQDKFTGALVIDDPIKPDDAYKDTVRNKINNRFMNTFKSRLALESDTPIILIMQRVHEEDPSGFLLTGGTGEKWHHLLLPVEIPDKPVKEWYPQEYTHGIPIEYNLPPGALWPMKHTQEDIDLMEKADPYTKASQYDQKPSPKGGAVFKDEFWKYYNSNALPKDILFKRIYADTAQEKGEHNDYTVFQCWAYSPSMGILLIDLFREKLETPELTTAFVAFWNKHKYKHKVNLIGVQLAVIEKKSSGSGLVQIMKKKNNIPVKGIDRTRGKVVRAMDTVPQIASGNVWLPEDAEWLSDFLSECRKFTPLMTHKNDDQIDPLMDAITDMLIEENNMYLGAV